MCGRTLILNGSVVYVVHSVIVMNSIFLPVQFTSPAWAFAFLAFRSWSRFKPLYVEFFYGRIIFLYARLVISFCLVISLASYTNIFRTLRYHQTQVGDQQQPSQTNALNMARFRKAVYSGMWVQLALVVCYAPLYTVTIVIAHTEKYSLL